MKLGTNAVNGMVAGLALTLSVASFGQGRGLSTRIEGKVGERTMSKSAEAVNPEALKTIQNSASSAVKSAEGLIGSETEFSATENLSTEQKISLHGDVGLDGAQEVVAAYTTLSAVATPVKGDNGLPSFVVNATTSPEWTSCSACQTGLANKLNQAVTVAKEKGLTAKDALREVMTNDGSMKKYEELCATNPIGF